MSKDNEPNLFDFLTKASLKHGTAAFFRGVLAVVVAMILLAYSPAMPDPFEFYIQLGLMVLFVVGLVYSIFSMFEPSKKNERSKEKSDSSVPSLEDQSSNDLGGGTTLEEQFKGSPIDRP